MATLSGQSAKCYNKTSSFQRDSGHQFIQQLSLGRGCRVLDLGCGTGSLAAVLSECVGLEGKVIAVDPDGERLKVAQEKYARDNIEYVSANDATFPDGPYDLVFSNQVIHWIHNKEALFRRVYENLKSGGRFAFSTANGTPVWPPVANDCMSELFWPDFITDLHCKRNTFLRCDQYEELAVSCGFEVTSMEDRDVAGVHVENVSDLIEFFFGLLQGDLDRTTISKQDLQVCSDKYNDIVRSEADCYLKVMKVLHVVFTKP